MRFATIYPAAFLAALAAAAVADYPLSHNEQHRLAVYCSYVVATHEGIVGPDGGGGTELKEGDTCRECRGLGTVGDGAVMVKCNYNENGLYCKNGKLAAVGSATDAFGAFGGCDCCDECKGQCGGDCCDECTCDKPLTKVQIRQLGEELVKAMAAAKAKRESLDPATPPATAKPLTAFRQTDWNWQGVGNPPLSVKRKHLVEGHGLSSSQVDRLSDAEITSLHNLLHNEELRRSAPKATTKSSSSCPGGNCPTSSAGRSGGCPGGNCPTSGSKGYSRRGLFGRFR
jgi:hypothetical protein